MLNTIFASEDHIAALTDRIDAKRHKHWMLQMIVAVHGEMTIEVEGVLLSCGAILLASDTEHSITGEKKLYFTLLIEHTSRYAQKLCDQYLIEGNYWVFTSDTTLSLQNTVEQLVNTINAVRYTDFIRVFLAHLRMTQQRAVLQDKRITEVIAYIKSNSPGDLSIEGLSKAFYLSKSRLSHLFKKETGMPLSSYVLLRRIENAYWHLLGSGNITEAAMNAGFDSPSHFASTSKRMIGMSAKDLRKDSVFLKVSGFNLL